MTSASRTWTPRRSWRRGTTASAEWMVEAAASVALQGLGAEHAAEPAADDDNLLLFYRFHHGLFRVEALNHT
jgi:hypothetical protein